MKLITSSLRACVVTVWSPIDETVAVGPSTLNEAVMLVGTGVVAGFTPPDTDRSGRCSRRERPEPLRRR